MLISVAKSELGNQGQNHANRFIVQQMTCTILSQKTNCLIQLARLMLSLNREVSANLGATLRISWWDRVRLHATMVNGLSWTW